MERDHRVGHANTNRENEDKDEKKLNGRMQWHDAGRNPVERCSMVWTGGRYLAITSFASVICTTKTLTSCFVHAGRLEGCNKNGQLFSCSIQRCILDIWNHITEHRNRIILKTLQ